MGWQTRSLPGRSGHRPSPKWVLDQDSKLVMGIAIWGATNSSVTEDEFLKAVRQGSGTPDSTLASTEADSESDPDATRIRPAMPTGKSKDPSPTAKGASLGPVMQAWGERIAKSENAKLWQVAVEAVALRHQGSLLQWAWAGEFSLLVSTDQGTELLAHQRASRTKTSASPLPTLGLGLEGLAPLVQGETHLVPQTRMLLLYSSALPGTLLQGPLPSFSEILRILSEEASEVPHWVALYEP